MVSNASGFKQSIPLNSSPFTPNGLVEFTNSYPAYRPSGEFQYFDIFLKFKENIVLDRPVLGGLSISFVPEKQSEQESKVTSSIVATFAYLPATGLDLDTYAPALELLGPTINRKAPDFFPLNLLPDFTFLLNRGDVRLGYQLENSGQIFLQTTTQVMVETVGLFGQKDEKLFEQSDEAFLVPGQQTQENVDTSPLDSEKQFLGIGVYRFTVAATGQMGDQIETSTSNQKVLVIFPWKQTLLALGLLIIFRRRIGRAFNWFVGYAKALRDFRYNAEAKPNLGLETQSLPELEPKAVVKKKARP
jgi:hypothetical protein